MISSEVQRTLVKSPPELWAEISDPAALARHLGEFGEIRITRVDPERKVEWEAGDTSGTVVIKPSGWGTKVKLTVTRETPEADAAQADAPPELDAAFDADLASEPFAVAEPVADAEPLARPEPTDEPEPAEEPAPVASAVPMRASFAPATHAGSEFGITPRAEPEPELEAEPEHELQANPEREPESEAEPRRGFFARLFGRRRAAPIIDEAIEPTPSEQAIDEPASEPYNTLAVWAPRIETEPVEEPEPEPDTLAQSQPREDIEPTLEALERRAGGADPVQGLAEQPADEREETSEKQTVAQDETADISAEIKAGKEVAAEQVTAVLTGVLDRLGAAHHRPFSRA
jgi:hypothetical protein